MKGRKPNPKVEEAGALKVVPDAPASLSSRSKIVWQQVASDLVARGSLSTSDLVSLTVWCRITEQIEQLQEILDRDGLSQIVNGSVRSHWALSVLRKAESSLLRIGSTIGTDPAAKQRIKPVTVGQDVLADAIDNLGESDCGDVPTQTLPAE